VGEGGGERGSIDRGVNSGKIENSEECFAAVVKPIG